jgi:hypothetical protein
MGDNYMIAVGEAIKLGLGGTPTHVLIFDVDTPIDRQVIIVDKRDYEIRFAGETESTVEVSITRKVHSNK